MSVRAYTYSAPSVGGSRAISVSQLTGLSVRETGGAAASFRLRKGVVGGDIVVTVALAANQSFNQNYDPPLDFSTDSSRAAVAAQTVFLEVVSGAWEGSLFGY